MKRYYNSADINKYIQMHHLEKIIPDIANFGSERLSLTRYQKGERPLWQNESEKLIFLVEGSVKNCAIAQNGKKILLHFSRDFEILRDLELLSIPNLNVEVEAMNTVTFLEVNLKGIQRLLMDNPVFLRAILQQVGLKLAKTTIAQTMTAIYPLDSRLASYLVHMAETDSSGKPVFQENLVETSELLGTSYRHLLRILKGFCENGILTHQGKGYFIEDIGWLQEKACDQPIYSGYFLE